jgi:glutaminase
MRGRPGGTALPPPDELRALLDEIGDEVKPLAQEGDIADYIPSLAAEDPDRFALAVSPVDGAECATGDADVGFPIQSVGKTFALALALQKVGEDVFERVGKEPSGDPFNSMVQLEHEKGIPRNPHINAGALVVCDVLLETCDDPRGSMIELMSELCGEEVSHDEQILAAEEDTGHRNAGMAYLMSSFGNLRTSVDEVMAVYLHQCAVKMSARQLARAVRFLANDGVDPRTGRQVVSEQLARRVNALMLTTGTYDSAGQFAYEVGIPCKSGVAGAIVGDVPGMLGVCVWSPPLDASGNSRAGREALHLLAERLQLSVF